MAPQLVLPVAIIVVLFHPFIFLWLGERKRNKKLIAIAAQFTKPEEGLVSREEVQRLLAEKEREVRSKELALGMANKQLDKLDRAKFEFVSVTTHQLRTPLSAIKWTFHMLVTGQLGPITDDQKIFSQKGYESTDRAIAIVNELLHIDSLQEGKETRANYQFSNVNISELVQAISFPFANQLQEKRVKFTINQPESPVLVTVDVKRLGIALENLLDNAAKYTKSGGEVLVTINDAKLNSARSTVEITISDTGIGIPEEEQRKIFQRFFRSSNAVRLVTDGNGLGLSIVKDIIDNHGGEIWFESKENGGTTFHIVLPVQRAGLEL